MSKCCRNCVIAALSHRAAWEIAFLKANRKPTLPEGGAREASRCEILRVTKRHDFFGKYSGFWSLVCLSSKALKSSDALGPSSRNSRALRIAQQRMTPSDTKNYR